VIRAQSIGHTVRNAAIFAAMTLAAASAWGSNTAERKDAQPKSELVQSAPSAAPSTTLPADIPLRRDPPASAASSGATSFLLIGVLVVGALLLLFFARRNVATAGKKAIWAQWLGATSSTELKTIAGVRLTPRSSMHVVQWRNRRFLIGCSDHGVSLIAEEPAADAAPAEREESRA
jgi:flagellar biogenesis protein FliO